MKKAFIGSVLFIGGILSMVGSLLCAAVALPSFNSWSSEYPSRLFAVLFQSGSVVPLQDDMFSAPAEGVGLGGLFVVGILLLCLGLIVMLVEYFKKKKAR